MKTIITTLLATIAIPLAVSASPTLILETTITEHHATGGPDVMKVPRFSTESGKQSVITVGKLEYSVTPTLLDNGTVELHAVLTESNGDKADVLTAPTIRAKIGQAAEIKIGDLTFATTTSLAK
ncbi:MAG: hypothetical protein ACOYM3_30055 [Terrimicrobiaceae bacterium]